MFVSDLKHHKQQLDYQEEEVKSIDEEDAAMDDFMDNEIMSQTTINKNTINHQTNPRKRRREEIDTSTEIETVKTKRRSTYNPSPTKRSRINKDDDNHNVCNIGIS